MGTVAQDVGMNGETETLNWGDSLTNGNRWTLSGSSSCNQPGRPRLPCQTQTETLNSDSSEKFLNEDTVIYVLGGPGSGKGTQCSKIVSHFGFCHLSAGELLQAEIESGSEYSTMIQDFKKEGKLVPAELIVKLLQQAMRESKVKKFLIDGFPRNLENLAAAENIMKIDPDVVLYFDCPEEELTRRLLNRNQGRVDDNIETIKKRLKVYFDCTLPVIDYYCSKGKVQKINADRPIEEVFEAVKCIINDLKEEESNI